MPKTSKQGHAIASEVPATLRRSDQLAADTFAKTYDAALEEYDDESRAARTAWASVKHTHQKVGDHWEPKEHYGPSDERAEQGGPNPRGQSHGGVDANATKAELFDQARRLDVKGRSSMTKAELVDALEAESVRRTREAREEGR